MKKAFKIGFFLLLVSSIVVQARAEDKKIMLTLGGNLLVSSDSGFKDIYGSGNFYPEIKVAYKVYKDFYLWTGYGFLSNTGTIAVIEEEAKSRQDFLSIGAGYYGKVINGLDYKAEAGLCYVNYKEEAMELEQSGSAIGFRIDGALLYPVYRNIFAGATLGYMHGSDKIDDISIKLGGFKAGIALIFRF